MKRILTVLGLLCCWAAHAHAASPPYNPWPGACRTGDPLSAVGCQAQAVAPVPTDILLCWQPGQSYATRACQISQILSGGLPASFGALTVASLTASQIGAGPFASMASLTRTESNTTASYSAGLLSDNYTVNWGGDNLKLLGTNLSLTTTINGNSTDGTGPDGDFYVYQFYLNENALRNLNSTPDLSQDTNVSSFVHQSLPTNGVPAGRRMRDTWNWYSTYIGANVSGSSVGGDVVQAEMDTGINGLDDIGGRPLFQINVYAQTPIGSGGYVGSYAEGFQVESNDPNIWAHDQVSLGGGFSHAGIDLFYLSSNVANVTSATPGSPARSVTVDNILPVESGGNSGGPDFPPVSTAAQITTAAASATASTTIVVSNASYIVYPYFFYDLTGGTVTDGTRITNVAGNTITLSNPVTISAGDQLLFSPGRKAVTINGNNYLVAGVTLSGAGSTAGTVYFTANILAADAAHAAVIYPNNHSIWLCSGSATAPWCDIAFNAAGTASLRSDGSAGEMFTGALTVPQLNLGAADGSTGSIRYNSPYVEIGAKQLEVDGGIYTPNTLVVGGSATFAGIDDVTGPANFTGTVAITQPMGATLTVPALGFTGSGGAYLLYTAPYIELTGKLLEVDAGIYTPSALIVGDTATFAKPISLTATYTVATLPTCSGVTNVQTLTAVTDAYSPTWNNTLTGGGSSRVLAFCNGVNWIAH
jgi:hypothetical protein